MTVTTEQLALGVAVVSLVLSAFTFVSQRRDRRGELASEHQRAQQAMLTDLYQAWLSVDEQGCRRAVYDARDAGASFEQLGEPEQQNINHAIAMLNMISYAYVSGQLPRDATIQMFGGAAARIDDAAEVIGYYTWRQGLTGRPKPWRYFRRLAQDARTWRNSTDEDSTATVQRPDCPQD